MKTFRLILAMLLLISGMAIAQKTDAVSSPGDKKKIALRPNSRDYGPVIRDNFHQKKVHFRDKAKFMKARPVQKNKAVKPAIGNKNNKALKQEQMKRKRQMIQQRRALRK